MSSTQIQIPADPNYLKSTLEFVLAHTKEPPLLESTRMSIGEACQEILSALFDSYQTSKTKGEIRVLTKIKEENFRIEIRNLGQPLVAPSKMASNWEFINHGRNGQSFYLNFKLEKMPVTSKKELPSEEITVRDLHERDIPELSRLFHRVYGYDYIHDYVYFPEKLREKIISRDLISKVAALPNGVLVGHVGLLRLNQDPIVYEAALGAVDPSIKNQGLFARLFEELMKVSQNLSMAYCLYDFVTNHDYSQRLVSRHGCFETALFLGNQTNKTQAKLEQLGIGEDPKETDRYSLLVAVAARKFAPFGREIVLPPNLGETCEFILKPLGLKWIPSPRFYPMAEGGHYEVKLFEEQKAATFDLFSPGRQAIVHILDELRHLLRNGYQYIAIEVPLHFPGIGQIYDQLARHGFFLAGLVPFRFSSQLALRLQFLAPTKVSFSEIHVFSDTAKQILKMVQTDYERNRVL